MGKISGQAVAMSMRLQSGADGATLDPLVRGYAMGSLSMTCYGLGTDMNCKEGTQAATLPQGVPPEQTNV